MSCNLKWLMSHYIFMDYYMYIILITKNIKLRSPNVIEARGTKKKIETNKVGGKEEQLAHKL